MLFRSDTPPHDPSSENEPLLFQIYERASRVAGILPVWPDQIPVRFIQALKSRKVKELQEYATEAKLPSGQDYEFNLVFVGLKFISPEHQKFLVTTGFLVLPLSPTKTRLNS